MSYSDPVSQAFAVTPSDGTDFARTVRGLYVGGTGNVVAVFPDDTTVTFQAVPAGTILPIRIKRVNSTSTTATLMVALG